MSGRWDNKNTDDSTLKSKKTIILLMGIMITMWVMFFVITLITPQVSDTDCKIINEYIDTLIDTDEFYEMPVETQDQFYEMAKHCNGDRIIVK